MRRRLSIIIISALVLSGMSGQIYAKAEENNLGDIATIEVEQKKNLTVPSRMTIYDDEEDITEAIVRELERINNTQITSYSCSLVGGNGYYRAYISVEDRYGNTGSGTISVTQIRRPIAPVIEFDDLSIKRGSDIDFMKGVKAYDEYDGILTSKVKMIGTNVNKEVVGEYYAIYEVTDSDGLSTQATRKIFVHNGKSPTINAKDLKIKKGDQFDALKFVSAYDFEDGDITSKIVIENNNVNINVPGKYEVVFKVTDLDDNSTIKRINVIVRDYIGWIDEGDKWYYYDSNGVMQKNKWIANYYVGADGACYYNKWAGDYYCGEDGKYVKNKWAGNYYCGADGKYVKNKWAGDYYCGADGKYVKNKWAGDYYCGADGKYVKNKWAGDYYCGVDGKYVKNKWVGEYYCGADGKYAKNAWVKTSGKWYYCAGNGKYLKNTSQKIGNKTYKFDAKGVCLNP